MNITALKHAFTRGAARTLLIGKKYSPQTLTVVGIVGGVVTTVLASKATLGLPDIVSDMSEHLKLVRERRKDLSEQEYAKELGFVYAKSSLTVAKIYAPVASVGAFSIVCIVSAQGIMQRRNAALTAAYVAIEKGFSEYRKRVEEVLGSDGERHLYYQTKDEDIHDTKSGTVTNLTTADPNGVSIYARFFDETNPCWAKNAEYNLLFLTTWQNYFNDMLRARGHVFLNEVYDALNIERSQAGQVVGWVLNKDRGDNFIDFGLYNGSRKMAREFVNGRERAILLDFNVDGLVYNLI